MNQLVKSLTVTIHCLVMNHLVKSLVATNHLVRSQLGQIPHLTYNPHLQNGINKVLGEVAKILGTALSSPKKKKKKKKQIKKKKM